MSTDRSRPRFQPEIAGAEGRGAANAAFAAEAQRHGLRWRCDDCAFFATAEARCSVGWPVEALRDAIDAIGDDGVPVFCKAFEEIGA